MNGALEKLAINRAKAGFTLIEVAVAIAILGIGLTTVIVLQTRHLNDFATEQKRSRAAMYAKYMMTLIEVAQTPPGEGTTSGQLSDYYIENNLIDGGFEEAMLEDMAGFDYIQEVSSVELPLLEDALRRVDLTLSWGSGSNKHSNEHPNKQFTLVYFLRPSSRR